MVTRSPRWDGSPQANKANSEDSGKPGRQPVNTSTKRHEKGLEAFAKNALRTVKRYGGSDEAALNAGQRAHNAAEKTIKP